MKREPKKSDSLEIRLPHETKTAFMAACRSRGVTASTALRLFIHRYIASVRAPLGWNEEFAMFFTGKSLHRRLAIIGAAAVASAVGATISAPARAAVDVRVEAVFDWIDADRNGSISLAEFLIKPGDDDPLRAIAIEVETKSRFQGETREQLFRLLDRNADGRMILAELAAGCVVRTIVTPAIEAADSNRDGGITESELAAYLAVSTAAAGKADPARAATIFARGILGEHDSDGDGKIVLQDMRS